MVIKLSNLKMVLEYLIYNEFYDIEKICNVYKKIILIYHSKDLIIFKTRKILKKYDSY